MKNLILLLLCLITLIIILSSCGNESANFNDNVIIVKVIKSQIPKYSCYYYVTGTTDSNIEDWAIFCDKCGKFTVGDTLQIIKK